MFCHKCMSCPFGNTHFCLLKGGNRKYSFFLCYSQGAGWQRELVLIILTHMDNIHCWGNGRGEMKGRPKWRESPQPTIPILIISLSLVWLTPLGKTDISFLSTLSEDFAEFFPRIENLVCLRIRAPTFLDRVMFGRLTGKWIGKMLSAQQCRNSTDPRNQQFGFAGKIFSSSAQIYLLLGGNHPNKPELSAGG